MSAYSVTVQGDLPEFFRGVRQAVVEADSPYHAQGIVFSTWPEPFLREIREGRADIPAMKIEKVAA